MLDRRPDATAEQLRLVALGDHGATPRLFVEEAVAERDSGCPGLSDKRVDAPVVREFTKSGIDD